jgi:hypothetical protein
MQDLHQKWPHRWVNSKAEARLSKIAGTGVFAKEKIFRGETCGVLGGVIVHRDSIQEYRAMMSQVGIQIDWDFFECKCGSSDCRKQITSDDWKKKEIQQKYLEYFSPYLRDKIQK